MFHRLYFSNSITLHIHLGFTKFYLSLTWHLWNKHVSSTYLQMFLIFSYMLLPWDIGFIHKLEFSILKEWVVSAFFITKKIKIPFSLPSVIWCSCKYSVLPCTFLVFCWQSYFLPFKQLHSCPFTLNQSLCWSHWMETILCLLDFFS